MKCTHAFNLSAPSPLENFIVIAGNRWKRYEERDGKIFRHLQMIAFFPHKDGGSQVFSEYIVSDIFTKERLFFDGRGVESMLTKIFS